MEAMKTEQLKEIAERRPVSEARKDTLRQVVKSVEELGVTEISNDFYGTYLSSLKAKGYSPNTIGKHVSSLKSLLSDSILTKGWKSPSQETDNIYLTEGELKKLYERELEGTTAIVRDIFILLSFTGLRVSDYLKLNDAEVESGMYKIRSQKVGTWSYIPQHKYVKDILKKYNFKVPKLSNATINTHIKRACLLAGIEKWKSVKSHSGRRSLCSNLYLKGVSTDKIMMISGHKQQSNFIRYVKCSNLQKIELIKDIWK